MTTALPVAFYLRDLSGEASRPGGLSAPGISEVERRATDAHARGVLEGRAESHIAHEAALANLKADLERKFAAERQRWASEEAARFSDSLATSMDDIERRVSERVGRVLTPILSEAIRSSAVAELEKILSAMLAKGEYAKFKISGARDLVEAIEARLGGTHAGIQFVISDSADLTVHADDTILETQITAWLSALDGSGDRP